MRLKGIEKFKEKLPWYKGKRIFLIPFLSLITGLASLAFQLSMGFLPILFKDIQILQFLAPFLPIIGSGFILTLGFFLVYLFWRQKRKLLQQNRDRAYQTAIPFALIGIVLVLSFVINSIIPRQLIFFSIDLTPLTWYFQVPLNEILIATPFYFLITRIILALLFTFFGFLVVIKSLSVFGIDNMALVYVYYPEESKVVNHEIYSVLRHPTYHGLFLILIGGFFLNFSVYSLIFFCMFLIGMSMHLKFVEEKELIKRFGEEYNSYRKSVPALFFRLRDFKKYFSFLFC